MKFWQAMKALEEGKKIRRKDWEARFWINRHVCQCSGSDCFLNYMRPENYEYEWELYEEPVQTNNLEIAKSCYKQICLSVDELKKQGIDCEYPTGIRVNGEWFHDVAIEEPGQLLNFQQVVEGLKEGKRFSRKNWNFSITSNHLDVIKFSLEDFEATDWIEVK